MKYDLFRIAKELHDRLSANGVSFGEHGYPLVPSEMILEGEPEEIVPFDDRHQCADPSSTVLCHFANDERLYRRLTKLDEDIEILKHYQGVSGFDLSPRRGHDPALQEFNLVLSRMVDAYRAVHGVKILPNFRTGDISTLDAMKAYPAGALFAVGSLGCARGFVMQNSVLLRAKLLYARPRKLLIYGTLQPPYKAILDELGQPYRRYTDFQTVSRSRKEAA